MAIGNTNPTDKVGVTAPESEASAANTASASVNNSVAALAKAVDPVVLTHENDKMFSQVAELAAPDINVLGEKDQAKLDKTIEGRVVDLSSFAPAMRTAKLNLMPSGNLILSMYNGEQMFNHLMTPKERSFINDVLNNPDLEDGQKLGKLGTMVSSIAMSTQIGYNFDKSMSQGDSVAMRR